jgi:uncharacterized protein YpmB
MTSTEVIAKVKVGIGKYLTLQNVAIGTAILLLIVATFLFYQSYKKDVSLDKMKALQAANDQLKTDLAATIKTSDDAIKVLQDRLLVSSATVLKLKDQLKKKQEEYSNVKIPKDRQETIDRLHGLGYSPK